MLGAADHSEGSACCEFFSVLQEEVLRSGKPILEAQAFLGLALVVETKFYYVYNISA